jgi:hypothetical protein
MKSTVFIPLETVSNAPIDGYASSGNIITTPIFIGLYNQFSVEAFWTGLGTGTFSLQASNDMEGYPVQLSKVVNWVTLPDTFLTSVGSPVMWNYSNVGYRWLRVVYTVATGSITLSERVQLKSVG